MSTKLAVIIVDKKSEYNKRGMSESFQRKSQKRFCNKIFCEYDIADDTYIQIISLRKSGDDESGRERAFGQKRDLTHAQGAIISGSDDSLENIISKRKDALSIDKGDILILIDKEGDMCSLAKKLKDVAICVERYTMHSFSPRFMMFIWLITLSLGIFSAYANSELLQVVPYPDAPRAISYEARIQSYNREQQNIPVITTLPIEEAQDTSITQNPLSPDPNAPEHDQANTDTEPSPSTDPAQHEYQNEIAPGTPVRLYGATPMARVGRPARYVSLDLWTLDYGFEVLAIRQFLLNDTLVYHAFLGEPIDHPNPRSIRSWVPFHYLRPISH